MGQSHRQRGDYWLSLIVFALIAFGLIMIYSVSKYYSLQITDGQTDKYYLVRQLVWAVIGLVAWSVTQSIDYRYWRKQTKTMFYLTIFFLVLPVFLGGEQRHWVGLGFVQFQPSEIGKLTFILYLAGWLSGKAPDLRAVNQSFFPFLCIMAAVSLLMLVQGDLGTLSIYIVIATTMFIGAGFALQHFLVGGALAFFLLWLAVKIEPYRLERVLTFLNPERNVLGASYHIRNALIAIGSGGLLGLGFGQSRQKYLYLPESHTDSIFAIIAEELGFVRAVFILILFALIALRGLKIATQSTDQFARLTALGITAWLSFQAFVNLGAMLSIMPLTGVPLPFISYGGSSLIFLLSAVGILVNISKHQEA
ncbi:MAG: putative lipid II flippase FtsW [Patescibacteria group bacterium]